MQAAKVRGKQLGNPKMGAANKAAAAARDAEVRPILDEMRGKPLREIAQALTDRGIEAPRGTPPDAYRQAIGSAAMILIGMRFVARPTCNGDRSIRWCTERRSEMGPG